MLAELDLVGAAWAAGVLSATSISAAARRPCLRPTICGPGRAPARFDILSDAEFAVEIDPRRLTRDTVDALAAIGVNRASLGVQDVNPEVQRAINRWQPFAWSSAPSTGCATPASAASTSI